MRLHHYCKIDGAIIKAFSLLNVILKFFIYVEFRLITI